MATSRTGTATYKRASRAAKKRAKANGQTRCPHCDVELDYDVGLKPNSAESDHIIPHSAGGQDTIDNLVIICRRCNQSKGNRSAPKAAVILAAQPLKTSRRW